MPYVNMLQAFGLGRNTWDISGSGEISVPRGDTYKTFARVNL
jgi:hypothetical protein